MVRSEGSVFGLVRKLAETKVETYEYEPRSEEVKGIAAELKENLDDDQLEQLIAEIEGRPEEVPVMGEVIPDGDLKGSRKVEGDFRYFNSDDVARIKKEMKEEGVKKSSCLTDFMRKSGSITLDIEKGDILLGGRFKNVKTEVKDIGTDEKGQPTINGKKLLSFRIAKKMPGYEADKEEKKPYKFTKKSASDLYVDSFNTNDKLYKDHEAWVYSSPLVQKIDALTYQLSSNKLSSEQRSLLQRQLEEVRKAAVAEEDKLFGSRIKKTSGMEPKSWKEVMDIVGVPTDRSGATASLGRTHRLINSPQYANVLHKARNLPAVASAVTSGALMLGDDDTQDKILQAATVGLPAMHLPRLIGEIDAVARGSKMMTRNGRDLMKLFLKSGKKIPQTAAMALASGMIPYLVRKSKLLENKPTEG